MALPHSRRVLVGTLAGLALLAAGCSSGNGDDAAPAAPSATSAPAATASMNFGPACSAVPASGAGSFTGMAQDPVATAASNNPVLSSLVGAVKEAGLVDTLNSADGITVFAPTNDAFSALPKATLDLKIIGTGEDFKVNGRSSIVCGNVQTANATVYIIDNVLMPKS